MPRTDRMIVQKCKANWRAGLSELASGVRREVSLSLSIHTVSRRLLEVGLESHYALLKPLLKDIHRNKRWQWCRERRGWMVEAWRRLVFSDESKTQDQSPVHKDGKVSLCVHCPCCSMMW